MTLDDAPTSLRVWMARKLYSAKQLSRDLSCSIDHVCDLRLGRARPSLTEAHELERITSGEVPAASWVKRAS